MIPAVGIAIWNGNMTAIEIKAFIVPFFYAAIFGILGVRLVFGDKISVPRDPVILLSVLYGILVAVSFFKTTGSSMHFGAMIPHVCGVLTFILVVLCFEKKDFPKLAGLSVATAAVSSVYGIFQYFRIDRFEWEVQSDRVFSFFGNKNYFAIFLLLTIPLGGCFMVPPAKRTAVVVAAILTILMIAALTLSNSRGAYTGLCLAVAVSIVLSVVRGGKSFFGGLKKSIFLPVILIAITISAIAMPDRIKNDFMIRFRHFGPHAEIRLSFFKAALEVVSRSPFLGVGPGNFRLSHIRNKTHKVDTYNPNRVLANVHNDFLETWAEYGVFALFAYLGVLAAFALKWMSAFKKEEDPNRRTVMASIACALTGYLFYSQFSAAGRHMSSVFYFWLVMGIGYLYLNGTERKRIAFPNPLQKNKIVSVVCAAALVLAVAGTMKKMLANHVSDNYLKTAYDYYRDKKFDRALAYLDKAVGLRPKSVEAYYQRGGVNFGLNRIDRAAEDYMAVVKLTPGYVNVYYNLALCHYRMRNYEKAVWAAGETFETFPDYHPNLMILMYSTFRLNRFRESLRFCDAYLEKCKIFENAPVYKATACREALELKKIMMEKLKEKGGKHVSDT